MKHRRLGRPRVVRMVGVPALARDVATSVGEASLVGAIVDLRAVGQGEARVVLREYRAEQTNCRDDLLGRQMLITDHQYGVIDKGSVQYGFVGLRDRPGEIDAAHFRASVVCQGGDVHGGLLPAARKQLHGYSPLECNLLSAIPCFTAPASRGR